MDTHAQPLEDEKPELNAFGKIASQFLQYGANASNNLSDTFNNMTTQSWIRLIMIVGGYMLLRPYLMKFAAKGAVTQMEKEDAKSKAQAKISPNELRGEIAQESEEEEVIGDGTGADWGAKARVRQREVLQRMMAAEEKRREDEEDLKDIEDLLED